MKKTFIAVLLLATVLMISCNSKLPEVIKVPSEDGVPLASTEYKKVFLLAGQSNASGVCHDSELKKHLSAEEYEVYQNGFSNVKISYHCDDNFSSDFVSTKSGQGFTEGFFGPELGFAEYVSNYTNEEIYIIKYAKGGTQLDTEWLDGNGNRGELYRGFIDFVTTQMGKLENAKIVGMMWMQGESDCFDITKDKYYDNQKNFISYVREDLASYIGETGMVFADAGIADNWYKYQVINDAKIKISDLSDLNVYFSTTENGLRNDEEPAGNIDRAHYDSLSGIKLGRYFGQVLKQKLNAILRK